MKTQKFLYETRGGHIITRDLPVRFEVCGRCNGHGCHVNPAIDGHGLTAEDFRDDPDFEEGYFSGRYDVTCEVCDGVRVLPEVDEDRLTHSQRRFLRQVRRKELPIMS